MSRSRSQRKYYRPDIQSLNIPGKVNRILNLILIAFVLIVFRIWHLAVVQYDDRLDESRKPQLRVIVEPAKRATIRDRFNIPLAINKVQYNAAILYSQIAQIPSVVWENLDGKKVKRYKRKEYIANLAALIGNELNSDPKRLEDLIYSKASFHYHIPFVVKEDISESQYYRLRMLEKDWLGIHVQSVPKRHYPKGKVGSDVIGYMGAINRKEYDSVIQEIKTLENFLQEREMGEDPIFPQSMENIEQVRRRIQILEDHAYTIKDLVGKTGIEGRCEKELRGFHGRKSYFSDARGNFLRELPGAKEPLSGKRIVLTLSAELQEYAEKLLATNEKVRIGKVSGVNAVTQAILALKQPWIKGGGIIAMDPHTGEILAMASFPRIDPNDFIISGDLETNRKKQSNIQKWFESEIYLSEIWDQKRPLERELFDSTSDRFYEENLMMNWDKFLSFILPRESKVIEGLSRIATLKNALLLQKNLDELLTLSGQNDVYALINSLYKGESHIAYGKKLSTIEKEKIEIKLMENGHQTATLKKGMDRFLSSISQNFEKVLIVDLCRLCVDETLFKEELMIKKVESQTMSHYREATSAFANISQVVMRMSKELFHDLDFQLWRQENEKEFLKKKRAEEKINHHYAKPYLDYFDNQENKMFEEFWSLNRWDLIVAFLKNESVFAKKPNLQPYFEHFLSWHTELSKGAHQAVPWRWAFDFLKKSLSILDYELSKQYMQTMRTFTDLNRLLLGRYRAIRKNNNNLQLEKHLAMAFYPTQGYGYGRSQAYRQATTQGSIFKLITAYEALIQQYDQIKSHGNTPSKLNPLEMVDCVFTQGNEIFVGYNKNGKPIPQHYKGGRMPKSSNRAIGNVDILKALEFSSNPYFAILTSEILNSPEDLAKAAKLFSYGSKTGIDLPGEISGKVPEDLANNPTLQYATAIGQGSLVVTPLQTAVMLSAIANGGKILKPQIISMKAGQEPFSKNHIPKRAKFPYQASLNLIGLNFPLFLAVELSQQKKQIKKEPTIVHSKVSMPAIVRNVLLEGMKRVSSGVIKTHLINLSKLYKNHPEAISDFIELKDRLIGKTSTSEVMENIDMDLLYGTNKYTHVWFGGISFAPGGQKTNAETFLYSNALGYPELVIVVYLKYGAFGKEAAPIAAQMVKKWEEIKQKKQ
jgi:cell division protein FtsI/penicillin-binding protein 2